MSQDKPDFEKRLEEMEKMMEMMKTAMDKKEQEAKVAKEELEELKKSMAAREDAPSSVGGDQATPKYIP